MNEARYILDNNILSRLTSEQRRSDFVRDNCNVPTEVLDEARGNPDIETLQRLEYRVSRDVLIALQDVMAREPVGDTDLIDLYKSEGRADPFVLATALDGRRQIAATLFGYEWVVVSEDTAVRARAVAMGLRTLGLNEFVQLLEGESP